MRLLSASSASPVCLNLFLRGLRHPCALCGKQWPQRCYVSVVCSAAATACRHGVVAAALDSGWRASSLQPEYSIRGRMLYSLPRLSLWACMCARDTACVAR
jgi:hypothetical protein